MKRILLIFVVFSLLMSHAWAGMLVGSGGVVNLIANPTCDVNDTNWELVSGDETSTGARNTTSAILGAGDYKLSVTSAGTSATKPALKIYYTTTGLNLLGKTWTVSFDYIVNSGTCVLSRISNGLTGTLEITNETLSGSGNFSFEQTSDDVDDDSQDYYRLYFNGTSTFEIQIDNVSVVY